MNQIPEIDLYSLHLVRLVASHRHFTAASKEAGISQSALTRQVQGTEERIGIRTFDRTTRKVTLTEAGAVFLRETEPLTNILSGALRRVREEFLEGKREIRIGLGSSLSQAHLPGIFHQHLQRGEDHPVLISQGSEDEVTKQVSNYLLDLGVVTEPLALPDSVKIVHEMKDPFCAVTPLDSEQPTGLRKFRTWAAKQRWLLPGKNSASRQLIERWAQKSDLSLPEVMELESFDLMNQFVALGSWVAFVPRRSLSTMARKHRVKKLELPRRLSRSLVAIVPRHGRLPDHVKSLIDGILFS